LLSDKFFTAISGGGNRPTSLHRARRQSAARLEKKSQAA